MAVGLAVSRFPRFCRGQWIPRGPSYALGEVTVSRWVRVDRRYNQPYRLTGHAYRVIFTWAAVIFAWVAVGSVLASVNDTLGGLAALALPVFIGYRIIAHSRRRPLPRAAPPPQVPPWQPPANAPYGFVPYGVVPDPPLGERNTRVIPQDVKIAVAARDGGRCRQCGSIQDLHFDHVIPWSKGGANTVTNIQLLCGPCNRRKGADDIPA